jgi:hypothetical protein
MLCVLAPAALGADKVRSSQAALARYDALIKPSQRKHWSFQPVRRPTIPRVRDTGWLRNPIDAFVLAGLEKKGWKPAPAAPPRVLLRRVYFDLIGLPPSVAAQEAFLKNPTPEHLDRVVEELLARPAHGERWARHWLDQVRYADSNGYERDAAKPHVWRYRDYVIGALNRDKPYDRFILEQLAGDELPNASAETLIATGFYRLGPWDDEPADPKEDRFDQLDDMVSTTAQVFLGLTLGCARCHNHKFEPLTMHDYYRMVAVFAPLRRPQDGRTELDVRIGSPAQLRAAAERDRRIAALQKRNTELLGRSPLTAEDRRQIAVHEQKIQELGRANRDLPRGYFLQELSAKAPPTHLLARGKASRPGPEVAPGVPAVLVTKQPPFLNPGKHTTRRRLSLARWIASTDNPLTARVIVNRVWQFHFGKGLVATPSDFGTMGENPTHPQLLDWLADWFVREGWSSKKLHRLILTSNTYRMNKRWNGEYGADDPENALLWRVHYRRLEVEAIRDAMLSVTGQLNRTMYGPSMYPQVPKEALSGHSDPDKIWMPFKEREASRRTAYAFLKRSLVVPLLEVLDLCDTARTAAQRVVTTVAPQALTLMNSDFVNRQARFFAARLVKEVGTVPARQVERAYRLALCRPPTNTERTAMLRFLDEAEKLAQESAPRGKPLAEEAARQAALVQMCRVLFNLNEFVYTD